jgi:hypothetical protein
MTAGFTPQSPPIWTRTTCAWRGFARNSERRRRGTSLTRSYDHWILYTGCDEAHTVLFCRTEGARFLLAKPIVGPELLAAVSLVANSPSSSEQIGFVDALRSAVSRAGAFSGRPLVLRACSALFGSAKTPRIVRSRADRNLHTVA